MILKKIKIPFIVYGAGYNYFKGAGDIPLRGIEHLKETKDRAAFFSVRNDESYDRLKEQTGIDAVEIADPGFFVREKNSFSRPPLNIPYVLVQVAYDRPLQRFGSVENIDTFVDNMRTIISNISKRFKVIMAPHVIDDIELSKRIITGIDNTDIWNFSQYAFDNVRGIFDYYQNAEYVLAMRGHGQIIPIGMGTPVISLENHKKNIGLMRRIGLETWNIDILDRNFLESTLSMITNMELNRESISIFCKEKTKSLLEDTVKKLSVLSLN